MALLKSDPDALPKRAAAPSFSLVNTVDGKAVSLAHFSGKIVVVLFMCNHCPFVIPKMDEIAQLGRDFAAKGVVLLCINSNDPSIVADDAPDRMKTLALEKGYSYYLFDETQEVARAYGAVCTPDAFVFDKDHKLIYHGRINDAMSPGMQAEKHDLRDVLEKLVCGKPVEHWFLPSQGCSIKWK